MDPEKQDKPLDSHETLVQVQDPDSDQDRDQNEDQNPDAERDSERDSEPDSEPDSERDSEVEEDVRIFDAWMRRCRGEMHKSSTTEEEENEQEVTELTGSRTERTGSRAERTGSRAERTGSRAERTGSRNSLEPPLPRIGRRASLPCPSTLSSMTLSRLHVSTATPVTAKVLLRRSSSRRLIPQEVPPPPGDRERRGSLAILHAPPTIPEKPSPELERPVPKSEQESSAQPELDRNKPSLLEKRGHFRRRNVMSLSDADSVCLICHNDLKHGAGGSRELQCSHTFHKECIEEYLWRRQQCPTCHVQVSLPQTLLWTSTLNVP